VDGGRCPAGAVFTFLKKKLARIFFIDYNISMLWTTSGHTDKNPLTAPPENSARQGVSPVYAARRSPDEFPGMPEMRGRFSGRRITDHDYTVLKRRFVKYPVPLVFVFPSSGDRTERMLKHPLRML
jgi:hypothetical protein